MPGGVAARAGLKSGDLVLSVDGRPLAAEGPVCGAPPRQGAPVALQVRRGKRVLPLSIVPAAPPR